MQNQPDKSPLLREIQIEKSDTGNRHDEKNVDSHGNTISGNSGGARVSIQLKMLEESKLDDKN